MAPMLLVDEWERPALPRRSPQASLVALAWLCGCASEAPLPPLWAPDQALSSALSRLRDVDTDAPFVDDGFIYYTRDEEDGRRLHLRRAVTPGSPQQLLFSDDEVAAALSSPVPSPCVSRCEGSARVFLGALDVSADQRYLAVTVDDGTDRWRLLVKDLATGVWSRAVDDSDFSLSWDVGGTLYYSALDDERSPRAVVALRPADLFPTPTAPGLASLLRRPSRPRVVHREVDPSREVLVAPTAEGAALFVRPRTASPAQSRGRVLGYRLDPLGAWERADAPAPLAPGAAVVSGAAVATSPTEPPPPPAHH